jgi:ABC-2 type transport system permease protein
MSANLNLQKTSEWGALRGFPNLFSKESGAWWRTPRWWLNTLLWTGLLCGLTAFILFGPQPAPTKASEAGSTDAGGSVANVLLLGSSIFFEFGLPMLAIGTVVLAQDLIIGEKQSGVTEWLLSKPVVRRSYLLAKAAANALPVVVLMVGLPSALAYGLLSLRLGAPFPVAPFMSAVGIMTAHTLFYLTLTLMLGTVCNSRSPILGIAIGSILGGTILGGLVQPLFYVTPWILPKMAWLTVTGQNLPIEMRTAALVATVLWSVVFIVIALAKFEKTEF